MTHLLYQTDSYLKEFQSIVTKVDTENNAVALDSTAFYPSGGGQPCDKGFLIWEGQVARIIRVRKAGDDVLHFLESDSLLPPFGTSVTGQIDWDLRYKLMRTHSAMHVLCGVIFRDYGASVTGGDMDPLNGRMDFEFENLHKEFVQEIEKAVNIEVGKNLPIRVAILPRDQAFQIPDLIRTKINLLPEGISHVRTVEIVGLDLQADGGTHVQSTGEIGDIRIVDYKSKGKINKRIYLSLE